MLTRTRKEELGKTLLQVIGSTENANGWRVLATHAEDAVSRFIAGISNLATSGGTNLKDRKLLRVSESINTHLCVLDTLCKSPRSYRATKRMQRRLRRILRTYVKAGQVTVMPTGHTFTPVAAMPVPEFALRINPAAYSS